MGLVSSGQYGLGTGVENGVGTADEGSLTVLAWEDEEEREGERERGYS